MDERLQNEILNEELSGDVINLFFQVLAKNTTFRPTNVHLMGLWDSIAPSRHIQILPSRQTKELNEILHWVTFYFDKGILRVYDSRNFKWITHEQTLYLNRLFPQGFKITYCNVDEQKNNQDCGVYAIASTLINFPGIFTILMWENSRKNSGNLFFFPMGKFPSHITAHALSRSRSARKGFPLSSDRAAAAPRHIYY